MTAEKKNLAAGTEVASGRLQQPVPLLRRLTHQVQDVAVAAAEDDPARPHWLLAQAGDRDAFRALVEMFQDRVFRMLTTAFRYDAHTAEDLCQEVFCRVFRGLAGFDGSTRFAAWLYTIAHHVGIGEYRRRRAAKRAAPTVSLDAEAPATGAPAVPAPQARGPLPPERAAQAEFLQRVRQAVAELPEEFRAAVVLRDMEGLAYDEIGAILDLPAGTVRSRIHRGRACLADALREFAP